MLESGFDWEACLSRVRQRDEQAARELMGQLYPLVLKLVRAHLPKRSSEEDLCQMIFIKIFNNIDQFSGKGEGAVREDRPFLSSCSPQFRGWVSRIAINTCLNQVKAEKIRPELRLADLSEAEAKVVENLASTSEELDSSERGAAKELLNRLLGCLKPQERLIINLLHLEERTIAEVKAITGWNTPLVKVRAFRARQKLKSIYNELTKSGETGLY